MSEMRYDATFATKEVMRDATNSMNPLAKSQENWAIPQRATEMCAEFLLGDGNNNTLTVMVGSDWAG